MNCNPSRRITNRNAKDSLVLASSFALFQFFEQLLFQVATRRLFDCAPLSCYSVFLCLTFSSRPALYGTRQVRNLRSLRTDFPFLRFCVGIHEETLALLIRDKYNGNSLKLKNDRDQYHSQARFVV